MIPMKRSLGIKTCSFGLFLLFAFFALIFSLFKLSVGDYSKFLVALFIIVYIPGQSFLWIAKIKVTRLERVPLSLVLGMTSSTLVYKISGILNFFPLFIFWLVGFLIFFCIKLIKKTLQRKVFSFSLTGTGLIFLLIALLALSVLFIDNYKNGIAHKDGSVHLNMHYLDSFVRNAVIRELSHSIPPQMPFAAGLSLGYHHAMDIFISIFYKHLNIGVLDLLHRLTMTFYFALLMMTVFIFTKRWMGSNTTALMGVFLVLFSSGGFGYIGGLLTGYASYWGKLFYSFYFLDLLSLNSFLPSVSVLAAGFFCLLMYFESKKFSWLILTSFLFAVITDYKISYAAPILGALALTSLVYYLRYRETAPLKVMLTTGLILAPLVVLAYFHSQNGPQFSFGIRFINWIIFPLQDLRLTYLEGAWRGVTLHANLNLRHLLLLLPILIGFFVGSFGLSSFAIPGILKKLFTFRRNDSLRIFLTFFFLAGISYFFFFRTTLGGRPRNWPNIYVFYLSVIIIILFWSEKLISFLKNLKRGIGILLALLVILLSIPNVIHFLWAKVKFPQQKIVSESFLTTCYWLNENTEKEAVLLHSPNTTHVCYFANRRVVLDQSPHSYLTFHLTTRQIEERKKDIDRFFVDPLLSADVLTKYKVSYVWAVKNRDFKNVLKEGDIRFDCFSFLGGKKILKYTRSHALALCFENQDYSIYEVLAYPVDDQDVYVLDESGSLQRFKDYFSE